MQGAVWLHTSYVTYWCEKAQSRTAAFIQQHPEPLSVSSPFLQKRKDPMLLGASLSFSLSRERAVWRCSVNGATKSRTGVAKNLCV